MFLSSLEPLISWVHEWMLISYRSLSRLRKCRLRRESRLEYAHSLLWQLVMLLRNVPRHLIASVKHENVGWL